MLGNSYFNDALFAIKQFEIDDDTERALLSLVPDSISGGDDTVLLNNVCSWVDANMKELQNFVPAIPLTDLQQTVSSSSTSFLFIIGLVGLLFIASILVLFIPTFIQTKRQRIVPSVYVTWFTFSVFVLLTILSVIVPIAYIDDSLSVFSPSYYLWYYAMLVSVLLFDLSFFSTFMQTFLLFQSRKFNIPFDTLVDMITLNCASKMRGVKKTTKQYTVAKKNQEDVTSLVVSTRRIILVHCVIYTIVSLVILLATCHPLMLVAQAIVRMIKNRSMNKWSESVMHLDIGDSRRHLARHDMIATLFVFLPLLFLVLETIDVFYGNTTLSTNVSDVNSVDASIYAVMHTSLAVKFCMGSFFFYVHITGIVFLWSSLWSHISTVFLAFIHINNNNVAKIDAHGDAQENVIKILSDGSGWHFFHLFSIIELSEEHVLCWRDLQPAVSERTIDESTRSVDRLHRYVH